MIIYILYFFLQVSACAKDLGNMAGAVSRRTPRSGSAARQRRAQSDGHRRGLPRRPTCMWRMPLPLLPLANRPQNRGVQRTPSQATVGGGALSVVTGPENRRHGRLPWARGRPWWRSEPAGWAGEKMPRPGALLDLMVPYVWRYAPRRSTPPRAAAGVRTGRRGRAPPPEPARDVRHPPTHAATNPRARTRARKKTPPV